MIARFLSCFALAHALAIPATAQTLPEFQVFGEADTPSHTDCGVSYRSALAAVEANFRHNNLKTTRDIFSTGVRAYLNLLPVKLDDKTCLVVYNFSIYEFQRTLMKTSNRVQSSNAEYCSEGGTIGGTIGANQSKLNAKLRDEVDLCLSEYMESFDE